MIDRANPAWGSIYPPPLRLGPTVWRVLCGSRSPWSPSRAPFTFGPITFASPGTYLYRCTVHSQVVQFFGLVGMRGEIVVR